MSAHIDLYKLLNVARSATHEEIKSAYRKLALKLHPDTTGNDKILSEQFKRVKDAYEVLGDSVLRKEYDRKTGFRSLNQNQGTGVRTQDVHRKYDSHQKNYQQHASTGNSAQSNQTRATNNAGRTVFNHNYKTEGYTGFDEQLWHSQHYGIGAVKIKRAPGSTYMDLKDNRHQSYFRKKGDVESEIYRKAGYSAEPFHPEDVKEQAKDNLNQRRQQRREETNNSTSDSNSSGCSIS